MSPRRETHRFTGLPHTQAALGFAIERHRDQYRDSDRAPFITHPIEVAQLLHRDGHPDHVIAAALLHDVLEKTTSTHAELERRFGRRIARLVTTVSDDPSIEDYAERKHDLRDRVARADPDALAVFAADKIAKVRELGSLPAWTRTGANTSAKLTHYYASLQMLRHAAGATGLVECLDAEPTVSAGHGRRLEARVPSASPPARSGWPLSSQTRCGCRVGVAAQRSVWT